MHSITLSTLQASGLTALIVWELIWKGLSLWKAARQNDKTWFVTLLILNTAGILAILYIFAFSKREQNTKNNV